MHRISLRGPWNMAIFDDRIEASRKFHAPPGLDVEVSREVSLEKRPSPLALCFRWRSVADWPIDHLRFNESPISLHSAAEEIDLQGTFFSWDSAVGVGSVDLTGILSPFNEIVLVWRCWSSSWQPIAGRYLPDSQHPFHFDSWLEIQT